MPYKSPAETERANWRTLPEALAHIMRIDECSPEDAQRQISSALENGEMWPLRWEDERPMPRFSFGSLTLPPDVPPQRWTKAEIEEIDWEAGTAVDRSEYYSPPEGERRTLLVYRPSLERLWKEQEPTPPANETRGKPGPKPKLRATIRGKMLAELITGKRTPEQLRGDTGEALVAHYGGSQNTARGARKDALSRFSELRKFGSKEL